MSTIVKASVLTLNLPEFNSTSGILCFYSFEHMRASTSTSSTFMRLFNLCVTSVIHILKTYEMGLADRSIFPCKAALELSVDLLAPYSINDRPVREHVP